MKPHLTPAEAARLIIQAVNSRDASLYASVFAQNALIQIYAGPVRIAGRQAIEENRRRHFSLHPEVRAEIRHLVEIGNLAIMHDQVRLTRDGRPSDVVEIFTCGEDGLIVKVDVVQESAAA